MTGSYKLRRTGSHWLGGVCVLLGPLLGSPQSLPNSRASVTRPDASAPRGIKTERQRWTALREAKRLSERAESYEKQGKANEAERLAEEALGLEEQVRGPWHLDVAQRLDHVADLYTAHKKEAAAEPFYERARAIRERALSTHPDVYERDGGELRPKPRQPADKAVPPTAMPLGAQHP